jgi:hypothetical protein
MSTSWACRSGQAAPPVDGRAADPARLSAGHRRQPPRGATSIYAFGHQHLGLTLAATTGEIVTALAGGGKPAVDLTPFDLDRSRAARRWPHDYRHRRLDRATATRRPRAAAPRRPAPIDIVERRARLAKARDLTRSLGAQALLIGAGASLRYFTGVAWGATERLVAMLLPVDGDPIMICPAFELGSLEASLAWRPRSVSGRRTSRPARWSPKF